jgi:hypothetical protein
VSIDPHFEGSVLGEANVTAHALAAAGLSKDAIGLFDPPRASRRSVAHRARSRSDPPRRSGRLARVVVPAAIENRLDGARANGETLTALPLLPDPGLPA